MRRNSITRHFNYITQLLLKRHSLNIYMVAAELEISPSYAYQVIRMYACTQYIRELFAKKGLKLIYEEGELKLLNSLDSHNKN